MLQNRQIVFEIPALNNEFIFSAQLYLNDEKNMLIVSQEFNSDKGTPICTFSIVHSIIGDLNKFEITCRPLMQINDNCKDILVPIFTKYCDENLIYFEFNCLNYD